MGRQQPDQHNIDPAGGLSTDKKWEPGNADENLMNQDKERYVASKSHDQPMIPEAGTNPALRELREKKQLGSENVGETGE